MSVTPAGDALRVRPRPPVRIVHLGLGAFHRSHQAWYTDVADSAREWGIASFTGRRPDAAQTLAAQDGVFTLVVRDEHGDRFERVESIVEAHDGADLATLRDLMSQPSTAVITLTVTEAAYYLGADARLDAESPDILDDIAALKSGGSPLTMPGRVVDGLRARFAADAGPIAMVSCDNLSGNGRAARAAVLGLAERVDSTLVQQIVDLVSFVDTSVDRITPRTSDDDVAEVYRATGWADAAPVVAEPFASWVIAGEFPAGRPPWDDAGAVFVSDIAPFERRKLWLLNAAHSFLAYEGVLRGYTTVAEALADETCAQWVERLWDEAAAHLTEPGLDIPEYRAALLDRFHNVRIAHHLRQIAEDGVVKLRTRTVPVAKAELAAGRDGAAAARVIAAWIAFVLSYPDLSKLRDASCQRIIAAATQSEPHLALIALLDPELGRNATIVSLVHDHLTELSAIRDAGFDVR